MPGGLFAAVILLAFSLLADCQTTHMVMVGVQGSFYVPNKIIADVNDTVSFVFGGDFHTVTQGMFNSPCIPLSGGFSSGLAGRGPDFSNPTVAWNIRITNSSAPIWFYCEATVPTSHCATGMVGVINPASLDQFNDFQTRAKNVTSQPQITPAVTLSGVGAIATMPPTIVNSTTVLPPPASMTGTSTSNTPVTTSSTTPDATAMPSMHSHTTTIIAAAVGGGAGGLILLVALILCWKRYKNSRPSSSQFFKYNATTPPSRPSDAFAPPKGHIHAPQASYTFSPPPAQHSTTTEVGSNRGPASIVQRPSANQLSPVRYGDTHDIGRQSSFASTTLSPSTAATTSPVQDQNMDIGVLAREVAAVLMRSPDAAAQPSSTGSVREEVGSRRQRGPDAKRVFAEPRYPADGLVSRESISPAPPGYGVSGGDAHSGVPWH